MDAMKEAIRRYIEFKIKDLKRHDIYLSDEEIEKAVDKYSSMQANMGEIQKEIDKDVDELIEQKKIQDEYKEALLNKIEANKELENEEIPLEYIDTDIDKERADIMNIDDVDNIDDLKYALETADDFEPSLVNPPLTDEQLLTAKNETYKLYQDTEEDKKEYQKDPSTMIQKKMEYQKDQGEVVEEDEEKVDEIVEESKTTDEMVEKIGDNFEETDAHDIYETVNEDTPLTESGIEKTVNDPNVNPFSDRMDNSELSDMFEEEIEKEQELNKAPEEKEKPKVLIKQDNTNNIEGSIDAITLVVIVISIVTSIGLFLLNALLQ